MQRTDDPVRRIACGRVSTKDYRVVVFGGNDHHLGYSVAVGDFDGDGLANDRNLGRIWNLDLARLLGCESTAPCPVP